MAGQPTRRGCCRPVSARSDRLNTLAKTAAVRPATSSMGGAVPRRRSIEVTELPSIPHGTIVSK